MKPIKLLFALCLLFSLQSCFFDFGRDTEDDSTFVFESSYRPITIDRDAFEQSITAMSAQNIDEAGKIYVFSSRLFINERLEGFHIFDNSDPSNPIPLNFLSIPGVTDMAIRNNIYYCNQAVDLVAFEYNSNTNEIVVTKRIRDVFPELQSPDGFFATNVPENHVVIDWELIN